ncbi:MAG: translocation/assembly module TamB domain-containing protein [Gammaproteobacteria bacterium]
MLRRIILASLTALLLSLLLIVSGIYALLSSEAGSRYLLRHALPYVPGKLELGAIHGTLLDTLQLDSVKYAIDHQSVSIAHFVLAWRPVALLQTRLDVVKITAEGVHIDYVSSEEEGSGKPPMLNIPLEVSLHEVRVDDATLLIDGQSRHMQHLHFGVHADAQGLQLRQLQLQMGPLEMQLQAGAALPDLRNIDAQVRWRYRDKELAALTGEGRIQGDLRQLHIEQRVEKPFKVSVQGSVKLDAAAPEFDFHGGWQSIFWPLQGQAHYFSEQGSFRFRGSLDAYRAELTGRGRDTHSGPLDVVLKAQGNATQLHVAELRIDGKPGHLHSSGDLSWQRGIGFNFAVAAEQLQLQPWLPDWPGYLNTELAARGHFDGNSLTQATLDIKRLNGALRGYTLAAAGQIDSAGQRLTLKQLRLRSGNNRIELDGSVGERMQLDFKLAATQLAALWPGLQGSLNSSGKVGGSREQPQINAALQGRNIGYEDFAVKRIDAQFNLDIRSNGALDVQLKADDLQLAGQHFTALHAATAGKVQNHSFNMEMSGEAGVIKIKLQGGYRAKRWNGNIAALEIQAAQTGIWRLEQSAQLSAAFDTGTEIALSGFCLQQHNAQLCAGGAYQDVKGYHGSGLLSGVPLALLQRYLPENLRLDGTVGGRFQFAGNHGVPNIAAAIDAQPGTIILVDAEGKHHRFRYRDTFVHIDGSDGAYNVRYGLKIEQSALVDGTLRIAPQQRLAGQLHLRLQDLTLLAALLPEVQHLTGRVAADADVGGTLQQPTVKAELLFSDGEALIPDLGLKLYGMRLRVASHDARNLRIDGEIHSGNGQISLDGTAVLDAAQGWPLRLTIRGTQFQALRLPEAEAWIEPDLLLQTAGAEIKLTGTLRIPEAHIRLKQLPRSAISVSADQVIVGKASNAAASAKEKKNRQEAKSPLALRVAVKLGDKVDFSGYGLQTELFGSIEVNNAQGIIAAYGEVQMRNGKYTAYGQNLTIERGRFVFAGAADNPTLDIRATRASKTDQVTAILSVRGPLQAPLTQISSEPPLSQDQALAYLLTGRPLNSADSSESELLAKAALSYGLEYTQPFLKGLGIDVADIENDSTLAGSSLVLGKYLTPDFYISYVSNIFNNAAVVALRYRLSKSFSIETHTGTSHGLDFLFNKEVD